VNKNNNYSYSLDLYQRKAIASSERNTLIVAAPGSGKTTVIINRIKYLIENKGVIPDKIAVITFTKAAAENMKNRYKSTVNNERFPFFGTLHGLFYRILQSYFGKINIIEEGIAYGIISKHLNGYLKEVSEEKVKEVLNDISMYKSRGMNFQAFIPHIDRGVFIQCVNLYENYKSENKLLDFDDLQIKCKELFIKHPEILEKYRKRFDHILVDEFQDCDSLQIEILQLLNKYNSIFVVGDEDQSIYGFRGAKPECMVDFDKYFYQGKKLYLSMNYRSPQNIISMAAALINNNKLRNYKELKAAKGLIKEVNIIRGLNENNEAVLLCKNIINHIVEGRYEYKDNAILYRTNMESRVLIDTFMRNDLPFKLMDKSYNFYNHFICKDIISYLKLSLDEYDIKSFIRIANKPYRYISRLSIERLKREVCKVNCFDFISNLRDIPLFQVKAIKQLQRDLSKLQKMKLLDAIDSVIYHIGYIEYLKYYCTKAKVDFEEIKNILEELKAACSEFNSIEEFLNHVEKVESEMTNNKFKKDEEGVILSTIHGVKGMEFRNVYIFNCNEDTIPHVSSITDNLEEERRLFYVAITRTIDNLTICYSDNIKGKTKNVSRFVGECNINSI